MYDGRLFFFGAIIAVFAVTTSFSIESGFLTGWQGNNAGGATCNFLMLPVSGAALSQGFISFPGSIDAADVANFPANLALNYRNRFSLGHLEWFMGLRKEFMGAAFPILDVGTVGYHSQLFTPGSFKYARTIDEKVAKPSLLDYTLGMMFAKPLFNDRLGIGLSASYLESRLDALKANAWYTTMDLLFHPAKWWSVRGYIRHLGTPVNYGSYDERLPMQLGAIKTITWHQPVSDSLDNPPIRAECGLGIQKTAYEPIQLSVAAQYHLGPYVTLRSGYEYRYNSPLFPIGFSAGIGVSYGKYGIDGGWKYQSEDFGSVWAANITMQLEEIVPQTAREYLAHAQHHFDKNQFWISRYYARKALQRNPKILVRYGLRTSRCN